MTTTPVRSRTPKPSRSNGQWAVDGRAPLNANEVFKAESDILTVRDRIISTYARDGFDSIPSDDLHGRFRWWGLYTQRRPGIDGGRTAQLEPHELEDKYFMMRIRLDGGAITREQIRTLAGISRDFGRGTADITDRQNIQYHWIRVEDVPTIWERVEAAGMRTIEACGDCPRVILGSPVAGIAADELIDPTPAIDAITSRFLGDPELANLPRKFKTAITGHPSHDVVHEINDVSFVAVEHPDLGVGYDLWIGGGLSTAARLAERLGAFVAPDQVADVWHGVIRIFRDYGYRRLRNKARLKYLLADWGPEKFRQVLQDEYLGFDLPDGPEALPDGSASDHIGVHAQRDGNFYIGAAPTVGRLGADALAGLAEVMERVGSDRVRFTPHQKLLLLDVPGDKVDDAVAGLAALGLEANPAPFRRTTMACTGIEFCKLAIVDTKDTATRVVADLDARLADLDLDAPVQLSLNGCPNSCVRIQTSDIGLKGQLITENGQQVPGFQVHLGGGLATNGRPEAGLGRTVRGLKVPADGVADYVERVVRRWHTGRTDSESFAAWAHRATDEELS